MIRMLIRWTQVFACTLLLTAGSVSQAQSFLGFDKNAYPGDALLPRLRQTFSYTSYWLNNPPGETTNPWLGKRSILVKNDFGFLILFNGRLETQIKKSHDAAALGRSDAAQAVSAAKREGFPANAIIFLDQEEGGRLTEAQAAYLYSWVKVVRNAGFRAGVYCSGISVPDGPGKKITTAEDIRRHDPSIALWVYNDACPPAPGCSVSAAKLRPEQSGVEGTLVWQVAQSPRRPEYTKKCAATYSKDGNCYAPGVPHSTKSFLDMNISTSEDPSQGR